MKTYMTLNEKLTRDMFFLTPLFLSCIYLNCIEIFAETKFNIFIESSDINRISLFTSVVSILYWNICNRSFDHMYNACKNESYSKQEKIKLLTDKRILFRMAFSIIMYLTQFVRFGFIYYNKSGYNQILFVISALLNCFMFGSISSKWREMYKFVKKL